MKPRRSASAVSAKPAQPRKFEPWRKARKQGIIWAGIGVAILATAYLGASYFALIGLLPLAIAVPLLQQAQRREYGLQLEQQAIRSLKLRPGWEARPNVMLPHGGDLDLMLISPQKKRFAIEIKSAKGFIYKRGLFASGETFTRLNGQAFERDPIAQVTKAAQQLEATPVIWMPEAFNNQTVIARSGVVLVQGGNLTLKRAVGAAKWWQWW
jgi:hypothetical protein